MASSLAMDTVLLPPPRTNPHHLRHKIKYHKFIVIRSSVIRHGEPACEKGAIVGPGEGALQVHQGVTKGLEHRKQGPGGKRET
jgi:hypothetical protein